MSLSTMNDFHDLMSIFLWNDRNTGRSVKAYNYEKCSHLDLTCIMQVRCLLVKISKCVQNFRSGSLSCRARCENEELILIPI